MQGKPTGEKDTHTNKTFDNFIFWVLWTIMFSPGFFVRCFRDQFWVPRISKNYHRVSRIRENRVPRIREIGSLQVHTRYPTFSLNNSFYPGGCIDFGIKTS